MKFNIMEFNTYEKTYARWATEGEIKGALFKTSLNDDNPQYGGIPLFADSDSVYVDQSDTHSLIIGSTGAKKTRLIAMPTLRLYAMAGESFVVTDPKAELYERALPFLKERGYQIFVLNLRDPLRSCCWNPLAVPYRQYRGGQRDKAVELVNDMASCVIKDGYMSDPYWHNSAADLLAGLILILFECAQEGEVNFKSLRTLRTQAFKIVDFFNKDGSPFIRECFMKHLESSSFICSLLTGTADVADSTRGCIISVFDQALRPFLGQDNLIDMLSARKR